MEKINEIGLSYYDDYTINLKEGNYNATTKIVLEDFSEPLTINGNEITLDGNNQHQLIKLNDYKNTLILNDIIFTNFNGYQGSIIDGYYGYNTIIINNCTFKQNSASYGGTIYYGSLNISNSVFTENSTTNGGTICAGNVIIDNSTFSKNNAEYGGAISLTNGEAKITNSNFYNNTANHGDAISVGDNNLTLIRNQFINNYADSVGGAIDNIGKNSNIINNIFTKNVAEKGGAIYNYGNNLQIKNNTFEANLAKNGSAIYNHGEYYTYTRIINVYIDPYNREPEEDIITVDHGNNAKILNKVFKENDANSIEKAILDYGENNEITDNTNASTSTYGSTIYVNGTGLKIINNTFEERPRATKIVVTILDSTRTNTTVKINLTTDNKKAINHATINILLPNGTILNTATKNDGTIITPLNLPVGTHNIKFIYNRNNTYQASNKTIIITVTPTPTTTTIKINNNTIGNMRVTGTVKDKYDKNLNEGTLFITTNNTKIATTTIKNGAYNLLCNITSKGKYTLKAEYIGTTNYYPSNSTIQIDVVQKIPTIKLNPVKGIIGETITLQATLTDTDNNKVTGETWHSN